MSDHDTDLENELRDIAPAAPPARLAVRLAQELATPPRVAAWSRPARRALWASWSLTAAAAAAAAVAWWPAGTPAGDLPPQAVVDRPAAVEDGVVPVGTSNVLTGARDEGVVLLEDGRPARRVRLHFVDTVRLRDAADGADIAVSRPREEVRFVPVNLY
jgi:hypothetical protein